MCLDPHDDNLATHVHGKNYQKEFGVWMDGPHGNHYGYQRNYGYQRDHGYQRNHGYQRSQYPIYEVRRRRHRKLKAVAITGFVCGTVILSPLILVAAVVIGVPYLCAKAAKKPLEHLTGVIKFEM
jgi:hypothetical protein